MGAIPPARTINQGPLIVVARAAGLKQSLERKERLLRFARNDSEDNETGNGTELDRQGFMTIFRKGPVALEEALPL